MSSAERDQAGFQKLVEVAASHLGIGVEFQAIRLCHQARNILHRHLPDLEGHYTVVSFKNGQLSITADNPSIMQKIQIKSHLIKAELNQWLIQSGKNETLKRIKLRPV